MALRVLLADESSTIKKVFQLSLQDFAVEIKTVNVGLDVSSVAESFQPDIIFADILLQKKNGYEVAKELKANPKLKTIPFVLMWSNFMEIDEDKYDACGADSKLEKPFDVAALRGTVQTLVNKTKTQKLSQFLNFPSISQHFANTPPPKASTTPPPVPKSKPEVDSNWNMESFENIEEFGGAAEPSATVHDETLSPQSNAGENEWGPALPLEEDTQERQVVPTQASADNEWVRKDINEFKVDVGADVDLDNEEVAVDFTNLPEEPQEEFVVRAPKVQQTKPASEPKVSPAAATKPTPSVQLSEAQIEAIVRAQAEKIIESVTWKILPEIASQIVERELKKLLDETNA